jgi:hypothetical protein
MLASVAIAAALAMSLTFVNLEDERLRGREHYSLVKHLIAWRGICMIACLILAGVLQLYQWAERIEW